MDNKLNKHTHHSRFTIIGFTLLFLAAAWANADVPQTAAELWADFPATDKATPLEAEVHKSWEQQGIVVEVVRFTVAVIDGQKLKLAGFFAYPKDAKNLPGLVQCHGGGQRASVGGLGSKRLCHLLSKQRRSALGQGSQGTAEHGLEAIQPSRSQAGQPGRPGATRTR
jgi:hypothetical protein